MAEHNLQDLSQESLPHSILSGSAEALSHLKDLTEKELSALKYWCADLPIDSDVRNRLSSVIDQVFYLRFGK